MPIQKPIQKAAEIGQRSPYDRAAEMVEVLRQGRTRPHHKATPNQWRAVPMFIYPFVTAVRHGVHVGGRAR